MTTEADWAFRAQHLIDMAKSLEIKAAKFMKQAEEYRARAARINPTSAMRPS